MQKTTAAPRFILLLVLLLAAWSTPASAQVVGAAEVAPAAPARVTYVVQCAASVTEVEVPGVDQELLGLLARQPYLQAIEASSRVEEEEMTLRFRFADMETFLAWYGSEETVALLETLDEALGIYAVILDAERIE